MLKRFRILLLFIMISISGNNVNADYEKLAYEFNFKDLDGSSPTDRGIHITGSATGEIEYLIFELD